MQFRILPALAGVAMLVACSDAPSGPGSMSVSELSSALGNPPPPAFSGFLVADFELGASGDVGSLTPELSLSVSANSTRRFRFQLGNVQFGANEEQTYFWMRFPRQPFPREWNLGTALPYGRIHQRHERTVGTGIIANRDERNRGWWLIDMSQFTVPYQVFVNGCANQNPNWQQCVTLNVPIVAEFVKIKGRDERGELIVERRTSNPAIAYFASGI